MCTVHLAHAGWPDWKRLGRLGQLHCLSSASLWERTWCASSRGFLGPCRRVELLLCFSLHCMVLSCVALHCVLHCICCHVLYYVMFYVFFVFCEFSNICYFVRQCFLMAACWICCFAKGLIIDPVRVFCWFFLRSIPCLHVFDHPVLPRCSSTLQHDRLHDGLHDGFLISCVCLPLWLLSSCCVASCEKMAVLLPFALCCFVSAKFTQVRWFIWCLSRPFRTCSPCRLCLPWCLYIVGRMSRLHETRQEEEE